MSLNVDGFDPFFHVQHTWQYTPGFHQTNGVYGRYYIERHYCATLLYIFSQCWEKWAAKEAINFVLYLLGYFFGNVVP